MTGVATLLFPRHILENQIEMLISPLWSLLLPRF